MFRILLTLMMIIAVVMATSSDLYEDQRNIVPLTDRTFAEHILNQDQLILINYYKHWSPECQHFSRIFKNFSHEILPQWSPVIKLAAVNCAEYLICYKTLLPDTEDDDDDDYNAGDEDELPLDFPVIQVIFPGTKEISEKENVQQYRNLISIDDLYMVTLSVILGRGRPATTSLSLLANRFSLLPLVARTPMEICHTLGANEGQPQDDDDHQNFRKLHFAIIESSSSMFGAMIILDLVNYREFVTVKRFVSDDFDLREAFGIHHSVPVILEFYPECRYRVVQPINSNVDAGDLHYFRRNFVQSITQRFVPDDSFYENRKIRRYEEPNKVVRHNLSYVDLYNAIRYSLVHEITLRRRFSRNHIRVIQNVFHTILDFFPFDNENVRRFFKRMSGWLDTKQGPLDTERYLAAVRTSDGFLKPMETWRHCNGSKPIYRGYPCGFWVLFHTMAVNEYNLTTAAAGDNRESPSPRVLPMMRQYVQTFFTCPQCRRYFLTISQDLDHQLIYRNSSVMWLWRVHNSLNSRLALDNRPSGQVNDDAEDDDYNQNGDPFFPKIQFPSQEICPACFDFNRGYNETEVLNFLSHYYSKAAIRNRATQSFNNDSAYFIIFLLLLFFNF